MLCRWLECDLFVAVDHLECAFIKDIHGGSSVDYHLYVNIVDLDIHSGNLRLVLTCRVELLFVTDT